MLWNATTDRNTLDSGAKLNLENGYSDKLLQQGEEIAVVHRSDHLVTLTVVSAAADLLEVSDGSRYLTLKPNSALRADVVADDERSHTGWIVS